MWNGMYQHIIVLCISKEGREEDVILIYYKDEWIINFRAALDQAGFGTTQIVAPDRDWGIANDMLNSPQLMEAVSHLPLTSLTYSVIVYHL